MPENWTQLESARNGILTPKCIGSRCGRMCSPSSYATKLRAAGW